MSSVPGMKVTTETVRRVAAHAERLTAGVHGLAFVAKPGDQLRYVDKQPGGKIFTGRDASRRATAFYAGIVDADPAPNPPLVDRVLLEVTQRHAAEVDAGRHARQATGDVAAGTPPTDLRTDTVTIRNRSMMFAPIIDNQTLGEQRYVCLVDNGGAQPYAVGTCRYNDQEWHAGRYFTDLVTAIRYAATLMEEQQALGTAEFTVPDGLAWLGIDMATYQRSWDILQGRHGNPIMFALLEARDAQGTDTTAAQVLAKYGIDPSSPLDAVRAYDKNQSRFDA